MITEILTYDEEESQVVEENSMVLLVIHTNLLTAEYIFEADNKS